MKRRKPLRLSDRLGPRTQKEMPVALGLTYRYCVFGCKRAKSPNRRKMLAALTTLHS